MVDLRTGRVTVDGQEIQVTPKEFDILACLAADPGRVVTRQEILETAWDAHWYGPTKVLNVHVAALRRNSAFPGSSRPCTAAGSDSAETSALNRAPCDGRPMLTGSE